MQISYVCITLSLKRLKARARTHARTLGGMHAYCPSINSRREAYNKRAHCLIKSHQDHSTHLDAGTTSLTRFCNSPPCRLSPSAVVTVEAIDFMTRESFAARLPQYPGQYVAVAWCVRERCFISRFVLQRERCRTNSTWLIAEFLLQGMPLCETSKTQEYL